MEKEEEEKEKEKEEEEEEEEAEEEEEEEEEEEGSGHKHEFVNGGKDISPPTLRALRALTGEKLVYLGCVTAALTMQRSSRTNRTRP